MKYTKLESIDIPANAVVTYKKMGKVIELTYNNKYSSVPKIKKLDSATYMLPKTGEVLEFQQHSETRADNLESIRKTMKRIKELIQTNVTDSKKVKFITFTYSVNMRGTDRVYDDFRKFNQKFQRYLKRNGTEKAEYIFVLEPQKSGSFHAHVLYIFNTRAPFIPNQDIADMWGQGFTKTSNLDNCENVAVYLTCYLCDLDIPIEDIDNHFKSEVKVVNIDGESKAFIKGRRLHFYPRDVKILRHSRGVKKPEKQRISLKHANELVKEYTLKYHRAFVLSDDKGFEMAIDKKEYCKINE